MGEFPANVLSTATITLADWPLSLDSWSLECLNTTICGVLQTVKMRRGAVALLLVLAGGCHSLLLVL
jgi:hypothetical protein